MLAYYHVLLSLTFYCLEHCKTVKKLKDSIKQMASSVESDEAFELVSNQFITYNHTCSAIIQNGHSFQDKRTTCILQFVN